MSKGRMDLDGLTSSVGPKENAERTGYGSNKLAYLYFLTAG